MEVERTFVQTPVARALKAARPARVRQLPPDRLASAESVEAVACRVLFRRLPELLSRMVGTSQEPGQVTFVFRLGYFDMAGLSQARKEFFQETGTGMRIMVEVPDDQPGDKKGSLQVKLTAGNLQRLSKRAAARVSTVRLDGTVKTRSSAARLDSEKAPRQREDIPLNSPVLRNLSAAVRAEDYRKLDLRPAAPSPQKPWLRAAVKQKKRSPHSAPNWLRRRQELVLREQRQIGPKAAENAHSAERQPHCLCPGCGREMESTLLYCPECTMRAARYIKIPETTRRGQTPQSLCWLISQAVSCF